MNRLSRFKAVLWTILGIGGAVALTRFIFGLGVTTNLTDNTPWGFWIGFDVMGGVALAAGGFVIAAINYIFNVKEFHAVSRAAILTAFLGYLAVAVGLLFDLGLPWNIWHMIIFWNPHSPLFEVGWCVMLYLTVLFLEFAPVALERWPNVKFLKKIYDFLYKFRLVFVILGIMLSTLHQSSLGSLFLAMPYRLHPLWYSPIIPIIFYVSAICLGMMMVIVESMTSSYMYKKEYETNVLKKLSNWAVIGLLLYLGLRFGDILVRGAGEFLFVGIGAWLFWAEIFLSVIVPIVIFSIPALKKQTGWLYAGALIGVIGVVFNRLNVGGLTHLNNLNPELGGFYFPSWTEFAISAFVVSAAILAFFYFVENFNVWEERPKFEGEEPKSTPRFGTNRVWLGPPRLAMRTRNTLLFVFAFGIAFAAISGKEVKSEGYQEVKAQKARGGDTLFIDATQNDFGVAFKHAFHSEQLGFECGTCHHMTLPGDKGTGCYYCHDMAYAPGDAFKHDWHASSAGADRRCFDCHDQSMPKSAESAKGCLASDCHAAGDNQIFATDIVSWSSFADMKSKADELDYVNTRSYADAMHGLCIGCHQKVASDTTYPVIYRADRNELTLCRTCHGEDYEKTLSDEAKSWVIIPGAPVK